MVFVQSGGSPDLARQGRARHKLFVEGSSGDFVDIEALKLLLPMIDIEAMGPSFHLKSVATALHPHHRNYYFLIDRDHHDDQTVNDSWINFPDPSKSNLLIWKKKEIENYFLDPGYLQHSRWIKRNFKGDAGRAKLEQKILDLANNRLLMEVANRVILSIREGQKQNWIEIFSNPSDFQDAATAKNILFRMHEFQNRKQNIIHSMSDAEIRRLFDEILSEMSGGQLPLDFACGSWLSRISGKEILSQVVNNCFQVRDSENQVLQGQQQYLEVIKDLARLDLSKQPDDFQELHRLIDRRTQ